MSKIKHKKRILQIIFVYASGWAIGAFLHFILHVRDSSGSLVEVVIVAGTIISGIMLVWYLSEWLLLDKLRFFLKKHKNKSNEEDLLRVHQLFEKNLITEDEYNEKINNIKNKSTKEN